jgi:hypothetical protein
LIPPYSERKKIDTIGATASNDPIRIEIKHSAKFNQSGQIGFLVNIFKNGSRSSPAIAVSNFGDPAKLWSAAPRLEKMIPACTRNLNGQDTSATKIISSSFRTCFADTHANKNENM